jgi:Holliday junction resolvase RusA-like endonuclease
MNEFDLFMPIKPTAKDRPRFVKKSGRVYTTDKTITAEYQIQLYVKAYMARFGFHMIYGNISMNLTFYYKRKKALKVENAEIEYRSQRPDLDNLGKLVMDSLQGVLYNDDSQIVILHAEKVWSDFEGIQLEIKEIL